MNVSPTNTALVWIRRDFRLHDHHALHQALAHHQHVLLVYIHDPDAERPWAPGAASNWWRHHSLVAFQKSLAAQNNSLWIGTGHTPTVLTHLAASLNASAVYAHEIFEPHLMEQARQVQNALAQYQLDLHLFNGSHLLNPHLTAPSSGKSYQVFTPYWRKNQSLVVSASPLPAPIRWSEPSTTTPPSLSVNDLSLLPAHPWHHKLVPHWSPGENNALDALDTFLEANLNAYPTMRDVPSTTATSLLSAALHFGELSPHQVWHAAQVYQAHSKNKVSSASLQSFIRQLGWREFATHVLVHHPHTPSQPLNSSFSTFPWVNDPTLFAAWKKGHTGWPLVDAGMKQLWETGWMHNRVRMLTAGVLCKQLGVDWRHGARWFWDTLVDADLANNTMGWQWSAGCGADAAPYFRMFNPHLQAQKFDPQSKYINTWSPVPSHPVVDLKASRLKALARFKKK